VIAHDGTDAGAQERRLAVRKQHLERNTKSKKEGKVIYGGAILDAEGKMVGSVMLLDKMTAEEAHEYIKEDQYVKGGVWKDYSIKPFRLAPLE